MSKYNVDSLIFPADLGSRPDLQHYVSFYINVRGKSKFDKNNRLGVVNDNPGSGLSAQQAGQAVKTGTAVASTIALAEAGRAVGGGRPVEATIAGAVGAGGAYVNDQTAGGLFRTDQSQRLADVISLHMQEAPSVKYGANYNDADLGILSGLMSMVSSFQDVKELVNNVPKDLAAAIALQGARLPSVIAGGGGNLGQLIGASARVKVNPFREVLFESVDYRTFNFRYRFMPRSMDESDKVRAIINKFKKHMHPELTENRFFYIYPSEFEIAYYYRGSENEYFNKIQNCALTDLQVEYGGDKFATFENGAPVETILTLTFRELELLNRDMVENNGY